MNRSKWLLMVLALALVLAACEAGGEDAAEPRDDAPADTAEPTDTAGEPEEPDGTETETTAETGECEEMDNLHVATPSQPPDFVQLTPFIARDIGIFEELCLEVELAELRSGINALRAMQSGGTDVSFSGTVSFVDAIGQGSPVKVWGSPLDKFDFQVVATESSGITSCEELAGNTIATDGPGGLIYALAQTFLATCGLDIATDVEVFIGSAEDFGPQMEQDVVQAGVLHTDEMVLVERDRENVDFNVLGQAWEFAADYHYISFGSTEALIEENRDAYVRMQAGLFRANEWMKDPANRDELIQRAVEITVQDQDVIESTYDQFVENFPTSCDQALPESSIEYLIALQQELGNLEADLIYEDVVDISVCQDAESLVTQ